MTPQIEFIINVNTSTYFKSEITTFYTNTHPLSCSSFYEQLQTIMCVCTLQACRYVFNTLINCARILIIVSQQNVIYVCVIRLIITTTTTM